MSTTAIASVIRSAIPAIDDQLLEYIEAILAVQSYNTAEAVEEAIGEVLQSCIDDQLGSSLASTNSSTSERTVESICRSLVSALQGGGTSKALKNGGVNLGSEDEEEEEDEDEDSDGELSELAKPICLGAIRPYIVVKHGASKSFWSLDGDGNKPRQIIDPKKLARAERRLADKARKRDDTPEIQFRALPVSDAIVSQAMNRKAAKADLGGANRSRDIRIENFDISFGSQVLLEGASLNLSYGIKYGLCGRNGVGKSTLLHMISNGSLIIPAHISILHVEQEVVGDDTRALDSVLQADQAREELLAEVKEYTSKGGDLTLEETADLNEIYAELEAIEAEKAPARAAAILSGLGFSPEAQERATKTFSGGWRMRIALARALFSKPDLLLLDEPTNMLDMKAILWLTEYLTTSWESTLLVVSHDRQFLSSVPSQILYIHRAKIETHRGNFDSFRSAMEEKERQQQRDYEAQQMHRKHMQEFIDKNRVNSSTAALVQSRIKILEREKLIEEVKAEAVVVLRFPEPEALPPPLLQLDEVSFGYSKDKILLSKVDLCANSQSRICIVGDNGSGKTTLLKILTGDLTPLSGTRHAHRNLAIGYFAQHHVDQLNFNYCALQLMAKRAPGKGEEHYRKYLAGFGVTGDLSLQSLATLSGGQKSRVAFAAMTLSDPHCLILDEPTNHLDVETVEALAKALNEYTGGVILVTHDQTLLTSVCTELWHCKGGTVTCLSGGFAQYRKIIEQELKEVSAAAAAAPAKS